jgi:hypothetical protein
LLAELAERIAAVRAAAAAATALLERPLTSVDLPAIDMALTSAAAAGVPTAASGALEARRDALRWEAAVSAALPAPDDDNSADRPRPSLKQLLELLPPDVAAAEQVDGALLVRVRDAAQHCLAWEMQASVALGSDPCALFLLMHGRSSHDAKRILPCGAQTS